MLHCSMSETTGNTMPWASLTSTLVPPGMAGSSGRWTYPAAIMSCTISAGMLAARASAPGAASTHGAPLPGGAGHWLVADPYPGHKGKSQTTKNREGDRARGIHQENGLHLASHHSLRAGWCIRERTRIGEWGWTWRHFPDGCEHVRAEGRLGTGPRPAATGVRLLVALGTRHHGDLGMGHTQYGERRSQPGVAAGRQVRTQNAYLEPGQAAACAGPGPGCGATDGARVAPRPRSEENLWVCRCGHFAQGSFIFGLDVAPRSGRQERQVGGPQSYRNPGRASRPGETAASA